MKHVTGYRVRRLGGRCFLHKNRLGFAWVGIEGATKFTVFETAQENAEAFCAAGVPSIVESAVEPQLEFSL